MKRAFIHSITLTITLADVGVGAPHIAGDEKGYISQYASDAVPPLQTASSGVDIELAGDQVAAPVRQAAIAYDATECHTLQELRAWRTQVLDHIQKFVPKPYQAFASKTVESKYRERHAQLVSRTVGSTPAVEIAVPEVTAAISDAGDHAQISNIAAAPSAGVDLRRMLEEVVNCNTKEDLEVWRSRVREFVDQKLPQEFKPFALADMQRHYEIRVADLRKVSAPPNGAQILAQMLADVDECGSEAELVIWRERVASHIRSRLPVRFQIPALGDMQMRFDRRLNLIQRAGSSPQVDASALPSSRSPDAASSVGFGTFTVVLGGLMLPACMAVVVAFFRARHYALFPTVCDVETHLLEA